MEENKFNKYVKLFFSGQFSKFYLISLFAAHAGRAAARCIRWLEFTLFVKPVFFAAQVSIFLMAWFCDIFSNIFKENESKKSECVINKGRLAVIIPNYKGEPFLHGLLTSLSKQTYKDIEIVVVDNDSRDGSESIVRSFTNVRWIPMGGNRGFAAAVNRGAEEASVQNFLRY